MRGRGDRFLIDHHAVCFPHRLLIDLSTRRVAIAGIATKADGIWMDQVARNLCDAGDGFLTGKRYLIHDRDPLFTAEFLGALGCQWSEVREAAALVA